ncbi:MAG: SPOR domain-containing protein [Acidobacteriaceae bacterium]|nr:SPOR domain-containing protein [Acidobacteriaceae bacterium]
MLRTNENETEILLGNKQLLGIFFVAAVLLGVVFAGGYKLGQSSQKKVAGVTTAAADQQAASTESGARETHSVPADTSGTTKDNGAKTSAQRQSAATSEAGSSGVYVPPAGEEAEPPLGTPKHERGTKAHVTETQISSSGREQATGTGFTPQAGETFLQVAAVSHDEAEAIADVLHKKGFRAHAAPKPGNEKIYRVLIGPVRDAGELSTTRDSLRRTGFREVIVQHY